MFEGGFKRWTINQSSIISRQLSSILIVSVVLISPWFISILFSFLLHLFPTILSGIYIVVKCLQPFCIHKALYTIISLPEKHRNADLAWRDFCPRHVKPGHPFRGQEVKRSRCHLVNIGHKQEAAAEARKCPKGFFCHKKGAYPLRIRGRGRQIYNTM